MIAGVLAAWALGALSFTPQQADGLWVGPLKAFSDQPITNYRHADLDGDGAADLLFDHAAWFQRGGGFPPDAREALPGSVHGKMLDTHNGLLYAVGGNELRVFAWDDGKFQETHSQRITWPGADPDPPGPGGGRLGRFLHDVDGDGRPELVAAAEDGLAFFAWRDRRYSPAGLLPVYPGLQLAKTHDRPLWPRSRRALAFPARQMLCDVSVMNMAVSVFSREPGPGGRHYHGRTHYPLSFGGDGFVFEGEPVVWRSPAVPEHVRPCRLNPDNVPDFAGHRRTRSSGRNLEVSLLETWASLDGGETFAVRRSVCLPQFQPQAILLDLDGDGLADLVTEDTELFDGGVRETVSRFMTGRVVPHRIRVYRQENGAFAAKPTLNFRMDLDMGGPLWKSPPRFRQYQAAELASLAGDFNGDGFRDLLVRDREDRVSLRLVRGWRVSSSPDAVLAVPAGSRVTVADVNADGRADLVVAAPAADAGGPGVTVYFAGGDAP